MHVMHFASPVELAAFLIESRNFYASLGWNTQDCQIGHYGDTVRMAGDSGAIDYTFSGGRIVRQSHGCFSKLAEFVDGDASPAIARHNLHRPAA